MIDWLQLSDDQRGLAVEGETDRIVIERFLDAGQRNGHWSNWRAQLQIQEARGIEAVFAEAKRTTAPGKIVALMDRDWRLDDEIAALIEQYGGRLFALPRVHIESYFVDPAELERLLLPDQREAFPAVQRQIEQQRDAYVQQGAMAYTLRVRGAEEFCAQGGYSRLRQVPVPPDARAMLEDIHARIEPTVIMQMYQHTFDTRRALPNVYHHYIEGKTFFTEVVVEALRRHYPVMRGTAKALLQNLAGRVPDCPADLIPILTAILA